MTGVVLDASAVLAWVLEEERGVAEQVDAALSAREAHPLTVPALFTAEVSNALRMATRRVRLTAAQAQQAAAIVDALAISTDAAPYNTAALLTLASTHELTAYDALYLDLAMRLGARLVTQDGALRVAAQRAGVPL